MIFAAGAVVLLAVGLLSALVLVFAADSRDLRGTAFASAHAHYLLWGTGLFAVLAGLTYWWPKIFGRLLDRRLTWFAALLLFVGFNFTFFFEFFLGDNGQPADACVVPESRRRPGLQRDRHDRSLRDGPRAPPLPARRARSPRGAGRERPMAGETLEWYTTSPPPPHNFDSLPPVTSPTPLGDLRRRLKERNAL